MISKWRHRAAVAAIAAAGTMAWANPANAADSGPITIGLASTGTTVRATDLPPSQQSCADVPGGAKPATDGWVFNQPIQDPQDVVYVLGYVDQQDATNTPVILGVTADGVERVPFNHGSPDPSAPPEPVPAGVAGGLLNGGAGGVWLQTPAGWNLVAGDEQASAGTATAQTFALAAVCLAEQATGTPSPPASASPGPSGTPPAEATATSSPTGAGPTLPITGVRTPLIAGTGVFLVLLGAALLLVRRRRDHVKFVA